MISFNKAKLIQLNPTQGIKMNDNILKNMITKITASAREKMSDASPYSEISESVINNNKQYKAIALNISQDEDKFNGHLLEVCVLDNSMREHKRPLAYGDANTILNYLSDKNILKNIQQDLKAILEEI